MSKSNQLPFLSALPPALGSLPEQALERSAALAKRWSELVSLRFREDVAFWTRLARCETPLDVQQAYFGFWKTAWGEYQEYFQSLMDEVRPIDALPISRPHPRHKAAA